eukprot:scaffold11649_cov126-Isochrysis_galbana.AAC.4
MAASPHPHPTPSVHASSTPNKNASTHEPWRLITADFVSWSTPERIRLPAQDDARSVIDLFPLFSWPPASPSPAPAAHGATATAATGTVPGTAAASTSAGAPAHQHTLVYKLEDNGCQSRQYRLGATARQLGCTLVLRQATAPTPFGPWVDAGAVGEFFTDAISRPCCEGAALVPAPDHGWILLFDQYREDCTLFGSSRVRAEGGGDRTDFLPADAEVDAGCEMVNGRPAGDAGLVQVRLGGSVEGEPAAAAAAGGSIGGEAQCAYRPARKGIGALVSPDLRSWRDVTGRVRVPEGYKHGTAVKLDGRALEAVCGGRWGQGPFAATSLCSPPGSAPPPGPGAGAPPKAAKDGQTGGGSKSKAGRGRGGGKARRHGGASPSASRSKGTAKREQVVEGREVGV